MKEYRCASYERLSKEDLKKFRTDESMSIEGQRLIINSYCQYNKLKIDYDSLANCVYNLSEKISNETFKNSFNFIS